MTQLVRATRSSTVTRQLARSSRAMTGNVSRVISGV